MPGNLVPQTSVKLSQQLMLLGFQQMDDTASPFDAKSVTDILTTAASIRAIGATNRFRSNQERINYRRRGVNSSMEAFALVPGPITTSVDLESVALNMQDAMGAFMFLPGNIAFQTRPIVLMEVTIPALDERGLPVVQMAQAEGFASLTRNITKQLFSSKAAASVGRTMGDVLGSVLALVDIAKTPTYTNCWASNSGIEYKLEGAQAVIDSITFAVGRVSPAVAVVLPDEELSLITNLPIISRGIQTARAVSNL